MIKYLKQSGRNVEEKYDGIYYVSGNVQFPAQIIVTSKLDKKHASLRILSNKATEDDIRNFIAQTQKVTDSGERNNIDAVLQVSTSANKALYEKIRKEPDMCQALMELLKEEIDEKIKESELIANAKGREEGREEVLEEVRETFSAAIQNIAEKFGVTQEEMINMMGLSETKRSKYIVKL